MQLAGFTLQDVIHTLGETVVSSAVTTQGERVVLKVLDSEQPAPEMVARWHHEFAVLQSLDSEWVIKARSLRSVGRRLVLVLEDFGPYNLAQLIERQVLDLGERLSLAIQLTEALSDVHQQHLIHGDIAPKNVLVDLAQLRLKLCDFGLSTRLDHEARRGADAYLRGTLEYMAPEQTGRTNLDVDYRCDFYSLGVTLYELFCGQLPFRAKDPMALLHAQLAMLPPPLHRMDPTIPEALSEVVQRLLAKNPDERYQSSYGLRLDLERCAAALKARGHIERFALASADIPERFSVAQKLYGRATETQTLLDAFERVANGRTDLLLVAGGSGQGKTALISELHSPIVARRGYFLRGKCDQYRRNQPYAALIQAFQPLMQQLAVEGEERRQYWRDHLGRALGEQAGAVTAIVPQLTLLIGPPPPLASLPAAETERRFHIAFANFVRALAARTHPLLIFLDDLQWADAPTLRLLEHLLRDESSRSTLIVGAYRDNEVDALHPLSVLIAALESRRGTVQRLNLGPLPPDQVRALIADTLRATPAQVMPLAELCSEKTAGNPFFLGQFLHSLVEQGDIHYERNAGAWRWQVEKIRQRGMTDNVVTLMLARLRSLQPPTQQLLAQAALLGQGFSLGDLMGLSELGAADCASRLWPALQAGLVLPLDESYKFDQVPALLPGARYRFLHDRVQQAAHELTPEDQRMALLLHCGRRLRDAGSAEAREERLFVLVDCLNRALPLITDATEREGLRTLNLRAGLRAKAGNAHAAAAELLRQALALLPEQAWQRLPEEALSIHRELAEAEYLAGHFEAAEALYPQALAACQDALGRVSLCGVQADQYLIQGRYADALPVLLQALAELGQPFPEDDAAAFAAFAQEFAQTEDLLARQPLDALLQTAEMQAPAQLAQMRLAFALSYASYQTGRFGAFLLNACRMVRTTLQHGQCDLSCVAYVAYLTAMSAAKTPYPRIYAMGQLALRLAEQRDNRYFRITVYQYFAPFYQHWGEPLANTLPLLDRGLEMGQDGINPLSSGFCALLRAVNRFVQGTPLDELEVECERGLRFLQRSQQPAIEAMLRQGVLQPVLALRGRSTDALSFDSADCSSSDFFAGDYRTPSIPLALYSSARLRHAYLMDDPEGWRLCAANLPLIAQCMPDSPTWVEACFFVALGQLRAGFTAPELDATQTPTWLAQFELWAQGCEANFRHKQLLIAAEWARVSGDERAAMRHYAQAIEAAAEADFPCQEALANELYAQFWRAQDQKQLAAQFIREAHFHYRRWGALAKCRQVEEQWPQLAFGVAAHRRAGSSLAASSSLHGSSLRIGTDPVGQLDLQALLKAYLALSQQIQLGSLLDQMLSLLLEAAGAELGAIVRADEGVLILEALGGGRAGQALEHQRLNQALVQQSDVLPLALLEFVQLTRQTLVVNQPAQDPRFAHTGYLRRHQPKSVLCMPVQAQGRLVALVYLENNLLENAFTTKQQQTLELLCTQAAISLVNARLYESLEEKVAQRTEALRLMSMKDGLTGIANRRAFDERLALEWRRSQRHEHPLSLLMVDIDHFKQFNDHYGHLEGDACIQTVAQVLSLAGARGTDLVARYGGEEFALLLPQTDAAAAALIAQDCLSRLAACRIPHARSSVSSVVSISIGISTLVAQADSRPETLIRSADQALYRAKREGRARYCQNS
ncbi:diguanylate cyclase (GGDEF)-like protein [Inhella inkyongensis]|uniref:Diguanylate cyclase (GGDEF)-like protein n=1 Tax=Inhella inkyongensis TaxID=392593 RepID=A0A840RYW6_9BURK|nr:diguanylate cyclase [Inhella inkyongensis]MBB5202743.1 diguanylate cyclase (GGDEF)-like protein [Inhella inkyongensis]